MGRAGMISLKVSNTVRTLGMVMLPTTGNSLMDNKEVSIVSPYSALLIRSNSELIPHLCNSFRRHFSHTAALEQQIRSTTATTLSSRFTTQLHTAESSLHNVPPYDLHQKLALETEVKILKAVVGLCAGFGAVSDGSTGLVGGMRGMSMEHGGVAMTQG